MPRYITLTDAELAAAEALRAELGSNVGGPLAWITQTLESVAAGHLTPDSPEVRTVVGMSRLLGAEILDAGVRAGYRPIRRDTDSDGW